jgi:hypothetical protein
MSGIVKYREPNNESNTQTHNLQLSNEKEIARWKIWKLYGNYMETMEKKTVSDVCCAHRESSRKPLLFLCTFPLRVLQASTRYVLAFLSHTRLDPNLQPESVHSKQRSSSSSTKTTIIISNIIIVTIKYNKHICNDNDNSILPDFILIVIILVIMLCCFPVAHIESPS